MKSLKGFALLPILLVPPMFGGQGVFDSLDPCIDAREQFQNKKAAALESVANQFAQVPVEDARKKFLAAWWTEARKMLRGTLCGKRASSRTQGLRAGL